MKRALYVVAVVGLLSGCASTAENLQRETARSIGNNISPSDVAVSDINRGATSVRLDAAAKGINYNSQMNGDPDIKANSRRIRLERWQTIAGRSFDSSTAVSVAWKR